MLQNYMQIVKSSCMTVQVSVKNMIEISLCCWSITSYWIVLEDILEAMQVKQSVLKLWSFFRAIIVQRFIGSSLFLACEPLITSKSG